jgi:hypothetical protein
MSSPALLGTGKMLGHDGHSKTSRFGNAIFASPVNPCWRSFSTHRVA